MLVLNLVPVVCILFNSVTMALATPIYIVVGFALTARINSIFLNRIFQKYDSEKKVGMDNEKQIMNNSAEKEDKYAD